VSFDRKTFFDSVRASLFNGSMSQSQVDGMEAILTGWETHAKEDADIRWLAYMLATTYHETSQKMQPIEEYGKGEGQPYGVPDADGKCWYGRGFVQLTWKENYERANKELGIEGTPQDCVADPDQQLVASVAAWTMGLGMIEGWFREGETLGRYFSDTADDAYGAREIINGDKKTVPSWSNGVSIGNLIKDYHEAFMNALDDAWTDDDALQPDEPTEIPSIVADITVTGEVRAQLIINGVLVWETEAEVA
jgi:putative chitinase